MGYGIKRDLDTQVATNDVGAASMFHMNSQCLARYAMYRLKH